MKGLKSGMFALFSLYCLPVALVYGASNGKNSQEASKAPADVEKTPYTTSFLYSYTDLNFNSTSGASFNRFQGHANQYGIGANRPIRQRDWLGGIFLYGVDTRLHSQMLFSPASETHLNQKIENYTLLGNVTKLLNDKFSVNFAAAYGYNRLENELILSPGTATQNKGYGVGRSSNWYSSLSAYYYQPWHSFVLMTNLRVLYSEVDAKTYPIAFPSGQQATVFVLPLTNRVTWIMENAELNYRMDDKIKMFVNAGLIQVADNYNSRPLAVDAIVGSLPQLSVTENAYRLGAGLSFIGQQWALRLEEKYYNSKGTYRNYQTIVNFTYQMA